MARRSRDWNDGLAEDLKDKGFAREFLTAAVEDGVSLQQALAKVVRATGVKEFAARVQHAQLESAAGNSSEPQPNARNAGTTVEAVRSSNWIGSHCSTRQTCGVVVWKPGNKPSEIESQRNAASWQIPCGPTPHKTQ